MREARDQGPRRFAEIAELYLRWLVKARGEAGIDDAFADYAHLNPPGREVFSALLAERLSAPNPKN